jgi:hypothetical protein
VILSYINCGNSFPITENRNDKINYEGSPIMSGYNSHYVITNINGQIYSHELYYSNSFEIKCDEVVVAQESQILPAFIIELNPSSIQQEAMNWYD